MLVLKGRGLVPGKAKGPLLKIYKPVSPLGDINSEKGTVHIDGMEISLQRKILFLPYTVGSTVGAYIFYKLSKNSIAPLAIIAEKADIVLLSGCIISKIPLVDGIKPEVLLGSIIEIDGSTGEVKIYL